MLKNILKKYQALTSCVSDGYLFMQISKLQEKFYTGTLWLNFIRGEWAELGHLLFYPR